MISPILQMRNLSPKEIKEFAKGQTLTEQNAMPLHESVLSAGSTLPLTFPMEGLPSLQNSGPEKLRIRKEAGRSSGPCRQDHTVRWSRVGGG